MSPRPRVAPQRRRGPRALTPALRGLLDAALDAVVLMDRTGTIVGWNAQAEATFGWSAAEAIGRRLSETIIPMRDRDAHRRGLARQLQTGVAVLLGRRIEVVALHRDGHEFPVELTVTRFGAGRQSLFGAFLRDVTERRHAEAALRQSERFLRQVIDLSPTLIFVKDLDGRFTLANRALADLYGVTVDEVIGRRDADFNPHGEEVERFVRDDREVMATGIPKFIPEEPNTDARTGLTRWFQVIKVPLPSADGVARQVLGVATELTQRKTLEDQLRQAQKMEAVGQLAGGIAHDFNNLLTAVQGFTALLLEDQSLTPHQRRDLEEIGDAAGRAAALTQQLLAFGRKQVLQPTILNPNQVVSGMSAMLRRLIGEHIELVTALGAGVGHVMVDRNQLEQVIVNLVVNARDAMPRGGRITLETAQVVRDDVQAQSHAGPLVRLAVSDTGVGMDAATRARIFEPFFTTKELGQGSGLGLATVYGIVQQSGGTIQVDSEPGRGSTFRVYLPQVEADVTPPGAEPPAGPPRGGVETVLVVEDEAAVRNFAHQSLERLGYRVLEAEHGAQALAVAGDFTADIDLLVTDVVMPGMSGRQLADRLAESRPGMLVLYTSGYTDGAIVQDGNLDPSLAYLPKPYTPDQLARRVRKVLDAASDAG